MIRSRLLLVVVLLLLAVAPDQLITQSAAAPTGTTLLETTGTPGEFRVGFAVGKCHHTTETGAWQVALTVPGPTATAFATGANQTIEWQPMVYQFMPGSLGYQWVQDGTPQSQSVGAGTSISFTAASFGGFPEGPAYALGGTLTWKSGSSVQGTYRFLYYSYEQRVGSVGSNTVISCPSVVPVELSLSRTRTTVNVSVQLTGRYFPMLAPVDITWKNTVLATVMSDANGNVSGTIRVPAAPLGDYSLGFDAGPSWRIASTLTIVPRIKVIPDEAGRGETVKISLRGFAKREVVRIRWKQGSRWVEIGRVTTSSTGSGQLYIPVPSWVTDGQSSVRGDGPIARAQTNNVFISGGDQLTLASESSPTPSPPASPVASPTIETTATSTPTLNPGTATATATATLTETVVPSETVTATETPTATETSTVEVTETVSPTESPPAEATETITAPADEQP